MAPIRASTAATRPAPRPRWSSRRTGPQTPGTMKAALNSSNTAAIAIRPEWFTAAS